jgi:hypothetical protein
MKGDPMKTYTSVEWVRLCDELKLAATKRFPHYGFDAKGAPIFYAFCRNMATLARMDNEYEIAYELEALPIKHHRLFTKKEDQ